MFDVFRITMICMGKPETDPQIICASEPDLTADQWKRLGQNIVRMAEQGLQTVDVDTMQVDDNGT